ncbi:MAG: hypothetical protein O3B43_02905 [Chloroflexi bacterium]|nr:hypothetical protein [Chloroflexota bacterium]
MSKIKLNAIATQALLDNEFKAAIQSGRHQEKLSAFQLNDEETKAVMSIEAIDVDQFIRRLSNLMQPAQAFI